MAINVGPGGPLVAVTTLTSAQLLAIHTTPVQVVAAPGAGKMILPLQLMLNYTFVTTAYTDGGGNLTVYPNGAAADYWWRRASTGFWTLTASQLVTYGGGTASVGAGIIPAAPYSNVSLLINNDTANPTLGDGTLTVVIVYVVCSVA